MDSEISEYYSRIIPLQKKCEELTVSSHTSDLKMIAEHISEFCDTLDNDDFESYGVLKRFLWYLHEKENIKLREINQRVRDLEISLKGNEIEKHEILNDIFQPLNQFRKEDGA